MLLAAAPDFARGLLLLAYPLHPPGRPERRRTEHLITLRTPTVFVHGTRDPFGLPDELDEALGLMPGPTRLITVRDAGHDLGAHGRRVRVDRGRRAACPDRLTCVTRPAIESSAWPIQRSI